MSLVTIERLRGTPELHTDVCIVGGGPAGIALGMRLDAAGVESVVLESGRIDPDPHTQALYRTQSDGVPYSGEGTRQRQLGGSSNCWTGWCRPLMPVDLKARPHVPHSGWPFEYADYARYLPNAAALCELGEADFSLDHWRTHLAPPWNGLPRLQTETLVSGVFQHSPPTRFGIKYLKALRASRNCRAVVGANVTRAELGGQQVSKLVARNFQNETLTVRARLFVLACGGIENARLLLTLNGPDRPALGNEHDQVGRYFTDHVIFHNLLDVFPTDPAIELYVNEIPTQQVEAPAAVTPWLGLSPKVQRERRLANSSLRFDRPEPITAPDTDTELVWSALEAARERKAYQPRRLQRMRAVLISEILPDPDSRVTLTTEKDALGVPRARLTWHVADADIDSARRSAEGISLELWRLGVARPAPVQLRGLGSPDDSTYWIGYHHYGTTRMSKDPRHGVVDAHGRVHSLDNLYVAGSSTFPTPGAATPTLSVVALALRLADHLKQRLRG